jgi:outer membrane lipoprotein-sorting protein
MKIPFLAALALGGAALAQSDAKPPAALDALVAALAKTEALGGEAQGTVKIGDEPEDRFAMRFVVKRPLLARYDIAQTKADGAAGLYVSDGKEFWIYDPVQKTYYSMPVDEVTPPVLADGATGMVDVLAAFFAAPAIAGGKKAAPWKDQLASAKTSDAEVGGEPCTVVRFETGGNSLEMSLSKQTGLPRRLVDTMTTSTETARFVWDFSKLDTAPPIDAKTFAFTPPEGAKKVETADEDVGRPLLAVGETAPDAAGPSPTAGKPLKLSDYRGKVVLLNFWFEH